MTPRKRKPIFPWWVAAASDTATALMFVLMAGVRCGMQDWPATGICLVAALGFARLALRGGDPP